MEVYMLLAGLFFLLTVVMLWITHCRLGFALERIESLEDEIERLQSRLEGKAQESPAFMLAPTPHIIQEDIAKGENAHIQQTRNDDRAPFQKSMETQRRKDAEIMRQEIQAAAINPFFPESDIDSAFAFKGVHQQEKRRI
ncbi:MAG TPA: hypothetical protein VIF12_03415 [Micavibrio sp.]|jgi:biopolymer transport protein ExbB/TolQ